MSLLAPQCLTGANFQTAAELVDMVKDLYEIEAKKEGLRAMDRYTDRYYPERSREGEYGGYGNYGRYEEGYGRYSERGRDMRYRDGGNYGTYRGQEDFCYYLDELNYGADRYQEGRGGRYGADKNRMLDGLEKMMHGICTLVETTMDIAETPEEKEIIKNHIQKLKNM